ncbi:MAG: guanylate kinase [Candidatus Magasanikbacteria bacterium CG11_big_fil_rev_8_21_14_0_20_43_7]|uniref:Guanylate kinase n=1 Tax=Candidatus Magasanikbacteria bacterium CG11_big_fil_rev_8_21_14_0_20_43_7 TaxID=1974654 RepID=A0A2H0N336_9BACT|nr:MAG: guanylate kinase [Candidatus Magasanikbacteria bacterium CG11_big_fil_rev_8_21_14_0_20_43_7]
MHEQKTGTLILISSPSGGGKNSVIKKLLDIFSHSTQCITTTTREKRDGENNGKDYFFRTRNEFESMMERGAFIETNEYAGNLYGTEKAVLDDFLSHYTIVFSQADVHGKHSLDKLGIPHLAIFLMPESLDILKTRIRERGGVSEEKLNERMKIAEEEMTSSDDYDYRIVNVEGKLEETVAKIGEIIRQYVNHV